MTRGSGQHARLTEIKLRFPAPDADNNIPDYQQIIRDKAAKKGFINVKGGSDRKGQGNINEYILNLIEADIGEHIIRQSELKRKNAKAE